MDTLDTKHQARSMISLTLPALLIGAGCSLVLLATMGVAEALQTYLWQTLPNSLGVAPSNKLWLLAMLTASGVAVGLLVRYAPGHAGPHPATTSLMSAPLPLRTLPGLAAATAFGRVADRLGDAGLVRHPGCDVRHAGRRRADPL